MAAVRHQSCAAASWPKWCTFTSSLESPGGQAGHDIPLEDQEEDHRGHRGDGLNFTANTGWAAGQVSEFEIFSGGAGGSGSGGGGGSTNLALSQLTSASGYTQNYVPGNATDGDPTTYWESTNNAFPQWLQVDLGAARSFSRIVLDLPPSSSWSTRTQTLSVQGSTDGSDFSTIVGSAGYTFPSASARYVRLNFTANTGWPAGQVSEFQVWTS